MVIVYNVLIFWKMLIIYKVFNHFKTEMQNLSLNIKILAWP